MRSIGSMYLDWNIDFKKIQMRIFSLMNKDSRAKYFHQNYSTTHYWK